MDMILVYLTICVVIGFIWGKLEAKVKGFLGERKVAKALNSLPETEYKVLNNIMLSTSNGTTQIDHVVVSVYGIFVIETKNYKGWIRGNEYSDTWAQNIYGHKYALKNPLHQNYGHIKALQQLLEIPEELFVSIVAFSTKATLKVKTKQNLIYFSELKHTIKEYSEPRIAQESLDELSNIITTANIDSKENRKVHIQNIHAKIEEKEELVEQGICPKCGGELVERQGKYGVFVGCSNYPKCKFSVK
jgi:hypothetical protein